MILQTENFMVKLDVVHFVHANFGASNGQSSCLNENGILGQAR